MNPKIKDAIIASFVADALCLGVHWVYNTLDIENKYGRLDQMVKPELAPYHTSKQKGEFTHYGDQMLILLKSIVKNSRFDLDQFSSDWQNLFVSYDGYMDHATKETLQNISQGKNPEESGSLSQDLAGASRIAPLLLIYSQDLDAFIYGAKAQTAMTHNQELVLTSVEFFARTAVKVLEGVKPSRALEIIVNEMPGTQLIRPMIIQGLESIKDNTQQTIIKFGQSCNVTDALSSTIHLIAKYEDNLKEALIENLMAGGDSSARGMIAGLIIGCYQGIEAVPENWLNDMKAYEEIIALIG
jgi:ADP-ribosylglycohydrolase